MKKLFTLLCLLISAHVAYTQGVGVGTISPASSAVLDVSSTTKGMLMPRMTFAQRNAIVSPASGLQILNIDDMCIDIYDGAYWIKNCGMKVTGTDTLTGSWVQKLSVGGGNRSGAVGFSIGNKGYIGTGITLNGVHTKDLWEFDPQQNTWTQKADLEGVARTKAVAFSIGNKGYLGTGSSDNGLTYLKDFWEYDPVLNDWFPKQNFGGDERWEAVGFTINGKGYIGTGRGSGITDDFWEYNPANNVWTVKAQFIGGSRGGAFSFSLNGKGYVGSGGPGIYHDMFEYDPSVNQWVQKADYGFSDYGVSFVLEGKAYVSVGSASLTGREFKVYDPMSNTWTPIDLFPGSGRFGAVGFAIGNKGYMGTGTLHNTSETYLNDFWAFQPTAILPQFQNLLSAETAYGINDGVWSKSGHNVNMEPQGNLGIGINSPLNKIDLHDGLARTGNHASQRPLYVTGDIGEGSNGIEFRHYTGTQGIGFGSNTVYACGSDVTQDLGMKAKGASGNLKFTTNDIERMRITGSGNVGIGIVNVNNKLDINNGATRTGTHPNSRALYVTGNFSASSNGVEFRHTDATQGIGFGTNTIYAAGSNTNVDLGMLAKGTTGVLKFSTNANERMRIDGAGNVGIGILIPTQKLHVVGNAKVTGNIMVDGVIENESITTGTLQGMYMQNNDGYAPAGYYKDKEEKVILRGTVEITTAPTNTVIFILPVGYRPSTSGHRSFVGINNNTTCRIDVLTTGEVKVIAGAIGSISLDGIEFRAD